MKNSLHKNKYFQMLLEGVFYFVLPIVVWYFDNSGFANLFSWETCIYLLAGAIPALLWPSFTRFKAMAITLELIIINAFYIGLTCVGEACMAQILTYGQAIAFAIIFNGALVGLLTRKLFSLKIKWLPILFEGSFYVVLPFIVWIFDRSGLDNPFSFGTYVYLSFGVGVVVALLWPSLSRFKAMLIMLELIIVMAFCIGIACYIGLADKGGGCIAIREAYGEAFSFAAIFNGILVGFLTRKIFERIRILK